MSNKESIDALHIEAMLETQIKANLILAQDLSDKETINYDLNLLVVSLAHDLIEASQDLEKYVLYPSLRTDYTYLKGRLAVFKNIANEALNSITDKGEAVE